MSIYLRNACQCALLMLYGVRYVGSGHGNSSTLNKTVTFLAADHAHPIGY